jgi:type IV secretion system protein VirB8
MLLNINNLLKRKEQGGTVNSAQENSWYKDRYESVLTQRNILVVLLMLSFFAVVGSVFVVGKISTSKSFSPFVIQIEERTGAAKVVNPANSNLLSGNESMSRYFIKKYISARESYNPVDFDFNMRKVVRLFSDQEVYRQYIGYIRNQANDPTVIYAQSNTTYVRVKSFSKLGKQYFVRFSVIENSGQRRVLDKIVTLTIDYIPMELNDDDRDINPAGFQVTGYRVDDDNS